MSVADHPFRSTSELEAFFSVYEGFKDRLAATVWLFENQVGNFALCDSDVFYATECLPLANVWKYNVSRSHGEKDVELATVHKKDIRRLLQHLLMVKHFRLEIFRCGNKRCQFEKVMKASPCDLNEVKSLLFADGESQAEHSEMLKMGPICSVVLEGDVKEPRIGMVFWHEATKKARVGQFFDNTSMDVLESMLIQHVPMECVVSAAPKYRQVKAVAERNNVLVTSFNVKKADVESALRDISNHTSTGEDKGIFDSNDLCLLALAHLKIHTNVDAETILSNRVEVVNAKDFVLFNGQADAGLNIFDSANDDAVSLFKILNKTRTSGGDRMLRMWLRQPLTDREKICERLDTVQQLVDASGVRKTLHESSLRRIPDFESVALKIKDKKAQLVDLYKAYMGIREVKSIVQLLSGDVGGTDGGLMRENFVVPLQKKMEDLQKFFEMVETTLDFDSLNDGKYLVNPNFDDKLQRLKTKLDDVKETIEKSVTKVANAVRLDKKSVKLDRSSQNGGYCFRVTMKDEKALRKTKGIFVVDTTKAGVRFRNHDLEHLNKQFVELNDSYEEQQQYVVTEILEIADGYVKSMSHLGSLISKLDCFVSFAVSAEQAPIPYVKPEVLSRNRCSELILEDARHPCLEAVDNVCFIPNSVNFSREENRGFCIITGPNMGGKSTYLRSVALNVLMAQVGSFVACKSAKLFPVDRVMVRIGAGDYQMAGVSTFMAEMLEASHIVRSATRHSLILIDELGRGTSTYDGLGLAWAISRHIASEIGAFTLFATHFHEITKLADEVPNVFNCYVDAIASESEFTLLYNVKSGSSNKSFGIEVAKLAGFPEEVVANARRYLQQAEMPLLRSSDGLDSKEVSEFLEQWNDDKVNRKRKTELLDAIKTKVSKLIV